MAPELSIVIPTHDRPGLLRAAVESALRQDLEVEVIIVDNGSPEPVALAGDPRLRVLRHERSQGGSAARNLGARAAVAPWVMWLDDDDELLAARGADLARGDSGQRPAGAGGGPVGHRGGR